MVTGGEVVFVAISYDVINCLLFIYKYNNMIIDKLILKIKF